MYVRNLTGDEFPLQATTTNDMELNGNQSISATIYPTKVNKAFINDIAEMWVIGDLDGVEHKIIYAKRKGEGDSLTVEVKAIPLFFDTFDTLRIYEEYNEHMTAQLAFTRIFTDTPFNFVLVDQFDAVQWQGFGGGESRLETFKRALERYKAEFRIVGNIVYLHKQIGRDIQFQYRYRLNASNITQENDANAMWTYAKGYGDYGDGEGGEDWKNAKLIREYTSPLAKIPGIGVRHAPPLENGNITTKEKMDEELKRLVDESLKISVSADIHDLRKQGYPLAQPEIGDRVFLIDERIGLDDEVRVVDMSITRNWKGEVLDLSLTFGSESIVKRHQSNLSTAIKNITELLAGKIKLPNTVYDDAIMNAVNAIKNAQTELDFTNGIWGVDPTNPNYVTGFTSHGFMVSIDGGATAEAAITGEGVIAEKIIGKSIIGVSLASINEKGYFYVSGYDAVFQDVERNRKVTISPDGLYGRDPDDSIRFQADRVFVTSSAFGTSNTNVYLAGMSNGEARVVDANGIPGDGLVDSYTYIALRAAGFYGNFWNINPAVGKGAVHLYARPLTAGELRVTLNETTDQYRDVRAREVFANMFTNNMLHGDSSHIYMRSSGELRVTTPSGIDSYRPVRASGFLGTYLDLDAVGNPQATHIYVRPAGDPGELRVTVRGTTDTYRPVRARDFITDTSERENKTDIEIYDEYTLDTWRNANAYLYRRANDDPDAKLQLGLMINELPEVTHSEAGDSFALYSLSSFYGKSFIDVVCELDEIKERLTALEGVS